MRKIVSNKEIETLHDQMELDENPDNVSKKEMWKCVRKEFYNFLSKAEGLSRFREHTLVRRYASLSAPVQLLISSTIAVGASVAVWCGVKGVVHLLGLCTSRSRVKLPLRELKARASYDDE